MHSAPMNTLTPLWFLLAILMAVIAPFGTAQTSQGANDESSEFKEGVKQGFQGAWAEWQAATAVVKKLMGIATGFVKEKDYQGAAEALGQALILAEKHYGEHAETTNIEAAVHHTRQDAWRTPVGPRPALG